MFYTRDNAETHKWHVNTYLYIWILPIKGYLMKFIKKKLGQKEQCKRNFTI